MMGIKTNEGLIKQRLGKKRCNWCEPEKQQQKAFQQTVCVKNLVVMQEKTLKEVISSLPVIKL